MDRDGAVEISGFYSLRTVLAWVAAWLALSAAVPHPGYVSAFFEPRAIFHYYLGAKYYNEIGPFDLYACAVAADRETTQIWNVLTPVRDLHTYALAQVDPSACPRDRFTAQRWAAFLGDFTWIVGTARSADWGLALTDKGYNATPFFSEVFGDVVHGVTIVPLDSRLSRWIVFNLDLTFLAIASWIVWKSAGPTTALLVLTLALGFFGNFGRIGGNLGQYVWFPWLTLAVAAWRNRRPALAGTALGIATGFQVFPAFFATPVLITGARSVIRADREGWMRSLVFSLFLLVAIASCVAVGSASRRGFEGWRTWQRKMQIHSNYLRGEVFDIGLSNLVGYAVSGDRASSDSYDQDIPHSLARRTALQAHRSLWLCLAALLSVLFVAAVSVVPQEAALAFGFVPLYALAALSPYYYFALTLLPFMLLGIPRAEYGKMVGALAVLFGVNLAIWGGSYVTFSFGWHAVTQATIAIYIVLLCIVPLASCRRTIAD
jgi:hypothetical protein